MAVVISTLLALQESGISFYFGFYLFIYLFVYFFGGRGRGWGWEMEDLGPFDGKFIKDFFVWGGGGGITK